MRGGGKCWFDSSHFRYVGDAHGRQLMSRLPLSQVRPHFVRECGILLSDVVRYVGPLNFLNSIANPHVMLLRYQCLHMYTHQRCDVQHCPDGVCGVNEVCRLA
ncbi:hypothetical protein T261_04198 [Streptomyces lydicus]|nr:hypothetical protein T261_04198 [Streptomyces lydicus]